MRGGFQFRTYSAPASDDSRILAFDVAALAGYARRMGWYSNWQDRRVQKRISKAKALVGDQIKTKAISDLLLLIGPDGFFPAINLSSDNPETLLESATWVYSAITGNAQAIGSLAGIVQQAGDEGDAAWVRIRDRKHALSRFLRHPLGPGVQPEFVWGQIIEIASMQLDICGNSYWRIIDLGRGGQRLVLEPLHPSHVEVIGEDGITPANAGGRIGGYRIIDDQRGIRLELPPEEVVHIPVDSPTSLVRGRPPIAVAIRPMTIDRTAQERQKHFLTNRIGPGTILNIDSPLDHVNDEQAAAVVAKLEADFKAVEKEGGLLVLSGASKLSSSPLPSEVQYFETRKFSRDEILGIFGVPPPIAGIFESATLQNFQQARRIWWENTLFPRLQSILEAFNRQAIQPRLGEDLRLWYSVDGTDIGLELLKNRAEVAGILVNQLGYPTNVAAAFVGLDIERIPELDAPNARFVTAGRVWNDQGTPIGDSPAEPGETTDAEIEPVPAADGI